ncbi:hypothetical protein C7974DRAFT_397819 [Boeremia exigua]|uniref:uncharacterized protein n=1 Tax=Boeremia exigua TaxID=749465 RepID=UPI001E8EB02F|nr:uncharacterized protein C7974DRAFT_397819 [Boeremia exigua]KAH6622191.1 hypothetical protein C7974DRAFT_397819 [Boeremia exigua]
MDAVPVLRPAATENLAPQPFLEMHMPWTACDSDEDMGIAFLPHFYDGGARHALGYFSIVQCPLRGRVLGTAFLTPCVEEDLRRFGLVEYVGSLEGVEAMGWVGCVNGKWLERDTVEDYAEWKLVFRIASVTWEGRIGLLRGELEGS